MRIRTLELDNWVCFKGPHLLDLDAKVYGVVAAKYDDPERSNWLGKSSLLEAVVFALYGHHRHRTEDDWITHGEHAGSVTIEFDNGMSVTRERKRGKSTQLTGNGNAKGDEAQHLIDEAVGLAKEDFFATCYFEQKRMSRFLTADPSERMGIVSGWLNLEPLRACEARVAAAVGVLLADVASHEQRIRLKREQAAQLLRDYLPAAQPDADAQTVDALFAAAEQTWRAEETRLAGLVGRLENEQESLRQWRRQAQDAEDYGRIVADGKALKQQGEPDMAASEQAVSRAREALNEAVGERRHAIAEWKQKQALSRGEFDGHCPIGDIQCPATDKLNSQRKRNLKLYDEAEARYKTVEEKYTACQDGLNGAAEVLRGDQARQTKLDTMREQARRLTDASRAIQTRGLPPEDDDYAAQLDNARAKAAEAKVTAKVLGQARGQYVALLESAAASHQYIAEQHRSVDTHREALLIFGRNGAQRRVAEDALSDIEGGANELLAQSGIDLRLAVQWSREGKGLADTCDACGAAFGASQRIKSCPRCGQQRGPKVVNKLDLSLTSRSGAAEDLAGGAFQLSASAWLRNARACAWGSALIDEPFGALDASNRQAFATHLATMLRGQYGFAQALVISHHPDTIAALPGRIEIVSEGGASRVRVC